MRKILEKCPSCSGDLIVTQLSCTSCDTAVVGQFQPTLFSRLSPDELPFVEAFVLSKGNVKEMERVLDISYWTIRNRLNEIIEKLGGSSDTPDNEHQVSRRQDILRQLDNGDIDVQEAADQLTQLRS